MLEQIINEFGHIDVLVNNVGIVYDRSFEEITIDEFKRTLEVNVIGAFITSREVSKYMKEGTIVNVSSTNGTKTISPECLDYNISKVGLHDKITFVAMRDIDRDEELTVDYAFIDNEDYSFKCTCGSENCRGVITEFD